MPDFLPDLKPHRDRVWLLGGAPVSVNFERYERLRAACPRAAVPGIYNGTPPLQSEGQAARWLMERSTGIVFSGGSAKGLAHIGVNEVLTEAGVEFDVVAGTSAGSLFGGMVACGMPAPDVSRKVLEKFTYVRSHPLSDFTFSFGALLRGNRFQRVVRDIFGSRNYLETSKPFFLVATNLDNGEEVHPCNCRLWEAVYASCSIPGFFPLRRLNGMLLADGAACGRLRPRASGRSSGPHRPAAWRPSPPNEQSSGSRRQSTHR